MVDILSIENFRFSGQIRLSLNRVNVGTRGCMYAQHLTMEGRIILTAVGERGGEDGRGHGHGHASVAVDKICQSFLVTRWSSWPDRNSIRCILMNRFAGNRVI